LGAKLPGSPKKGEKKMKKVFMILVVFMCSASLCFAAGTEVKANTVADSKAKTSEVKKSQGLKGWHIFPKEKAPKGPGKRAAEGK